MEVFKKKAFLEMSQYSCGFKYGSLSLYVITLPSFVSMGILKMEMQYI